MPTRPARILLTCTPLLVVAAAAILFYLPPTQYTFYPECPIHHYLGILCPGCGTTRALSALLHGHIAEAMRLNALTTLLLPIALFYAAATCIRLITNRPAQHSRRSNAAAYVILVAAIVFTCARNL